MEVTMEPASAVQTAPITMASFHIELRLSRPSLVVPGRPGMSYPPRPFCPCLCLCQLSCPLSRSLFFSRTRSSLSRFPPIIDCVPTSTDSWLRLQQVNRLNFGSCADTLSSCSDTWSLSQLLAGNRTLRGRCIDQNGQCAWLDSDPTGVHMEWIQLYPC